MGEIIPPWGTPDSVLAISSKPGDIYPASKNSFKILFSINMFSNIQLCDMLSKKPFISASSTQFIVGFVLPFSNWDLYRCSIASFVDLIGLKPNEFLSAVISDTGNRAIVNRACIHLSLMVGIPKYLIFPFVLGMPTLFTGLLL